MNDSVQIVALDGHDGAGKTTLATELSRTLGVVAVAPFSGKVGRWLMQAADSGNVDLTLEIGEQALDTAVKTNKAPVLILDRSWLTVASLVPWSRFQQVWTNWLPTVLCWSSLETTLARLALRNEKPESIEWHKKYLQVYRTMAENENVPILRTDQLSVEECVQLLADGAENGMTNSLGWQKT